MASRTPPRIRNIKKLAGRDIKFNLITFLRVDKSPTIIKCNNYNGTIYFIILLCRLTRIPVTGEP